jgi:hypothetical protein
MFFGGKKPPKPSELVKSCRDSLTIVEKNANNPKAIEKVGTVIIKLVIEFKNVISQILIRTTDRFLFLTLKGNR